MRLLAGRRDGTPSSSVGGLELKGIPEPVEAFEVGVGAAGRGGDVVPLPGAPAGDAAGRLRRAAPRSASGCAELWSRRARRAPRSALISGEPGIGKTRLATHTALERHGEGAAVLYGRCDEELALPYGPWIEALGHYVEHAPEAVLGAHVERHGGELDAADAGAARSGSPTPRSRARPIPRPSATCSSARSLGLLDEARERGAARAGARRPALGGQADARAAQARRRRAAAACALLMIGTYRESDLSRGHPLTEVLADLQREQGVERIALEGLERARHRRDHGGRRRARARRGRAAGWRTELVARPTATRSSSASCCAT